MYSVLKQLKGVLKMEKIKDFFKTWRGEIRVVEVLLVFILSVIRAGEFRERIILPFITAIIIWSLFILAINIFALLRAIVTRTPRFENYPVKITEIFKLKEDPCEFLFSSLFWINIFLYQFH